MRIHPARTRADVAVVTFDGVAEHERCTETLDAYADEVYAAARAPLGRSE
jgi:hypothetical protein